MYELRSVSDIVSDETILNPVEISTVDNPDSIYRYHHYDNGYFVFECIAGPCTGSMCKFPANYTVIKR